ncbi:MAG: SGNH/GDSL hydrolase family protein [Cyanobacteria bacterium P01_D01_bin.36]
MKLFILVGGCLAVLLLAALLLEAILRFGLGFGRPPLYIADANMGYRLAPSQRVRRLGNRIHINEYSMRAGAIAPTPAPQTLRLFLLGDSLANGNWWTDQNDILSKRIARALTPSLPKPYTSIEALNASANSWGPRNELAYLQQYGTFGSQVLVLLLNTDDLFGTEPTSLQVGRDRNYPSQNFPTATSEILHRLTHKNQPIPGLKEIQDEGGDRVGKNLIAINGIYQQTMSEGGAFILILSPLKRELPGPRDYELVARQRLQDWALQNDVRYLDLLPTFAEQAEPNALYRDHIHLSPTGNELVSQIIAKELPSLISNAP